MAAEYTTCVYVGNHVEKNGLKMDKAILRDMKLAENNGVTMKCCQIFVMGPRNPNQENLSAEEKIGIKNIIAETGLKLFVHGNYCDCICGTKKQWAWTLIRRELEICDEIGASGLIIHLPKQPAEEIAEAVSHIVGTAKTRIYLEIESYKPTANTYELPGKISHLMNEIRKVCKTNKLFDFDRNIGLCLDTAHAWAANVDIAGYEEMKLWLKEMSGANKSVIMHLNDQIFPLGAGRDQHAPLAYGTIWGKFLGERLEKCGLHAIIEWLSEDTEEPRCAVLERKKDEPKIKIEKEGFEPVLLPTMDNLTSDYLILSKLL